MCCEDVILFECVCVLSVLWLKCVLCVLLCVKCVLCVWKIVVCVLFDVCVMNLFLLCVW